MNQKEIVNISKYEPDRLQIIEAEVDYRDESFIANQMQNISDEQITLIQEKGLDFFADALAKATDIHKIKEILVKIIFISTIESYRFLESYFKNSSDNIKAFAYLVMTKSRFIIEQQFFANDQVPVYICSGLGGKDNKLKYFICYIFDKKLMPEEFNFLSVEIADYLRKHYNCSIEHIDFAGKNLYFYSFLPLYIDPKNIIHDIREIIAELDQNEIRKQLICNDKVIIEDFLKKQCKKTQ